MKESSCLNLASGPADLARLTYTKQPTTHTGTSRRTNAENGGDRIVKCLEVHKAHCSSSRFLVINLPSSPVNLIVQQLSKNHHNSK